MLEDDQAMLLACVVEAGQVLAILPLMKRHGDCCSALRHIYASLYSLLLAERNQQETLKCLVQGLSDLPVYSLRLEPLAENDRNMQQLQQAMEASGFECHRYFRFYNWIHRLQGQSFNDYLAARPARVRNTIARKQRKLEREHGYVIRLFIDQDLEQALADYKAVYQASWKANELFDGFIEGLAYSLAGPGWLRLAVLYIADKPAAAQFWFVVHGKASIFKLAYDEAWKQYSPGSILISYLMEHVIDIDKVDEIDFLTGNDAYKQDWMSERRERWGLYCAKMRAPKGRAGRFVDLLKRLLKPLQAKHS
ncbi:MAG: GNAT family N-acetyltransferase [Chromatiales bacterium]